MPVDRPTFSESWYRVVDLRPRLRAAVQIHRQRYRGQTWYVVQDPANNQFYRLSPSAYHFVGLLDGRRTVGQVWRICNDHLGDAAPTQGEAIQLLGQLYSANLIQADLPPDTASMFRRFRQRRSREVRGFLMNLLFVRIPLLDPDAFLDRWVSVVGWVFSPVGAVLWLAMMAAAAYCLAGRGEELLAQGRAVRILAVKNLGWLYLSIALLKAFHEFGHAFACKRFGARHGSGGEVHTMGVMFLVFTPLPYVDASSAWALPGKWQRAVVGMAGMLVELFIAAGAAVVWSQATPGTAVHTVCYNMMFVASVSSLLFNGNPLLRFDGYYIFSDLVEIPNLWQRGREYLHYLVKRYVWGVRRARNPGHTRGEKVWLAVHATASMIYRTMIVVGILLFVAGALPVLGAVLAAAAVISWVCVPAGKFLHYLLTNQELTRVRGRALATTAATIAAIVIGTGLIPAPDRARAQAVVRPEQSVIFARTDGFLTEFLPSGTEVRFQDPARAPVLVRCRNRELQLRLKQMLAEKQRLETERQLYLNRGQMVEVHKRLEQMKAFEKRLARVAEEINRLSVRAPHEGIWFAPQLEHKRGAYITRGDVLGLLIRSARPLVEAAVGQQESARIFADVRDRVQMRLPGMPGRTFGGTIVARIPAGQKWLPSAALSVTAGGEIAVAPQARGETAEPYFQVLIRPDADAPELLAGEKVAVRFSLPHKPLAAQWYRSLRLLVRRRLRL